LPDFKPTWLPELPPVEMAVKYVDGSGKQRVKGGSSLKASQSYPLQFLGFIVLFSAPCQSLTWGPMQLHPACGGNPSQVWKSPVQIEKPPFQSAPKGCKGNLEDELVKGQEHP